MSTEDGPGIRTTVFFKGCNLSCAWCHNPESISFDKEIYWLQDRCMGCLSCINSCPKSAISDSGGIAINKEICDCCGKCAEECPANALEIKGEKIAVDKLLHELKKDKAFFDNSKGGVTLSGGESVLHTDYVAELIKALKNNDIHTAIDTAGCYAYSLLEKCLQHLDLILYDIKLINEEEHKKYTGADNAIILENAKKIGKLSYPKVWVRTPIIPEVTDSKDKIAEIGEFIRAHMPNIERWELVSFNNLSKNKYKLLEKEWEYSNALLIQKNKMQDLCNLALSYTDKATWSGMTRLED